MLLHVFKVRFESVLAHYNFTAPEVWSWKTKGPPPQKKEETGYNLILWHLINVFFKK